MKDDDTTYLLESGVVSVRTDPVVSRACQLCEFVCEDLVLRSLGGPFFSAESLPWFQANDFAIRAKVFALPAVNCRAENTSAALARLTEFVRSVVDEIPEQQPGPDDSGVVWWDGEAYPGSNEFRISLSARGCLKKRYRLANRDLEPTFRGVIVPDSVLRRRDANFWPRFISDLFQQAENAEWAADGLFLKRSTPRCEVWNWPITKCERAFACLHALRLSRALTFAGIKALEARVKEEFLSKLQRQFPDRSREVLEKQVEEEMRSRPFYKKESTFSAAAKRVEDYYYHAILPALGNERPRTASFPRVRPNRIETRR